VEDRVELFLRLSRAAAQGPRGRSLAARLCDAARELLGADGAAIAMDTSASVRAALCATGEIASGLENLQDVLGEGPGQDALSAGQPVQAALGPEAEARWPLFAPAARRVLGGAAVVCSLPMRVDGVVIGTLSVYWLSAAPPDEPSEDAQAVAKTVAAALLRDPATTAEAAWSSRPVVHMAAGMVMAQLAVDAEAALAVLRSHAFATGVRLDEVAAAVVHRTLDLSAL
jgi:hypothetical protein